MVEKVSESLAQGCVGTGVTVSGSVGVLESSKECGIDIE